MWIETYYIEDKIHTITIIASYRSLPYVSVQSLSHVRIFATPWTAALQASLSTANSWSLLKLMSIESVMHPTISSSVMPFSSYLQSFPASGSFPMSQFFTSGGPSIGALASASVLPVNIQDWFPLGLTDFISLQSNGLLSLLQHHSSEASILWRSAFFVVQLSHPHMTIGKPSLSLDGPLSASNISAF